MTLIAALVEACSPVCDVRLCDMLQSLLQLRGTHVRARHGRKVFGEQQRALSGATADIHRQAKGTPFLPDTFSAVSRKPSVCELLFLLSLLSRSVRTRFSRKSSTR